MTTPLGASNSQDSPENPATIRNSTSDLPIKPPRAATGRCCYPTAESPQTHAAAEQAKEGGPSRAGIRQMVQEKNHKHRNRTEPQPWFVRNFTVFLVIGIVALTTYVYIGRVTAPMIQRRHDALGSKSLGVVFLALFSFLWSMFVWSYTKIVLTPPGFARDHVSKAAAPNAVTLSGPPYSPGSSNMQTGALNTGRDSPDGELSDGNSISPYDSDFLEHGDERSRQTSTLGGVPVIPDRAVVQLPAPATPDVIVSGHAPLHSRQPPRHPILAEEFRYCHKEGFVKPLRAHHCRMCATCVLNYDHHCPWIGQCVGARNRKFFVIFVFWAAIFTSFTGITMVILCAKANGIEALQIIIIALAGLFAIFTFGLLISHVDLIMHNLTTVEQYGIHTMERRESATLDQMFPWWRLRARRRTIRKWDEEWGSLSTEGNIWWLGNARVNWEATMGKSWIGWFLPIGHSVDDGLTYPTNPRFDSDGRWRRRAQWPDELR